MIFANGASVSLSDVAFASRGRLVWLEAHGGDSHAPPTIQSSTSYDVEGDSVPDIVERPREAFICVNPKAGHCRGPRWARELLSPLLKLAGVRVSIHETKAANGAKSLVAELVSQHENPTIVLCGGDGTTHEAIEGAGDRRATFVLVPLGTANALYSALHPDASGPTANIRSLLAFIQGSQPVPLPLAKVQWAADASALVSVVGSFALHASILYDAANDPVPGLERFKRAFEKNHGRDYTADLMLKAARRYNLDTRTFDAEQDLELTGPFAYVATALIDRFEPTFIVAPKRKAGDADGTIDVLVIRPEADILKITAAMYDGGKHIDLRGGNGRPLVDYFRVSGLTWKPTPNADLKSNLLCADGAVHEIVWTEGAKIEPVSQGNITIIR